MIHSEDKHQKSFIAVHAGAGYHAPDNAEKYLTTCRVACMAAMQCLKSGFSALDAVTKAVKVLEDSPCTNAGLGSNLTLDGSVECDAGVMDGKSLVFGAVGSISGVKNPVEVAHKLVQIQQKGVLSLGRIPPSVLVGEGARQWAYLNGFPCVTNNSLITDTSKRTYKKYKRKLSNIEMCISNKKSKTSADDINNKIFCSDILQKKIIDISNNDTNEHDKNTLNFVSSKETSFLTQQHGCDIESNADASCSLFSQGSSHMQNPINLTSHRDSSLQDTDSSCSKPQVTDVQDTVGAVCVDHAGNMAAAGSSGGIWLKQMGRLGPAAVFGAGCWAHNGINNKTPGIAVATTGCGEQLMKTLLAKECGDTLQKGDDGHLSFSNVLQDCFLKSEFLHGVQERNAGMLGLIFETDVYGNQDNSSDTGVCSAEVLWGHTTSSMCLGYMSEVHQKPRAMISRLPTDSMPGASVVVQGKLFML